MPIVSRKAWHKIMAAVLECVPESEETSVTIEMLYDLRPEDCDVTMIEDSDSQ